MLFVLLLVVCYLSVSHGYYDGATGQQCARMSAACQDQIHGPPNTFQPDFRYIFEDRGANDNVKQITFQNREGNLIGYSFQVRDFGLLSDPENPYFPRGYMTLNNLTYDRIFPCPGYDSEPHSNGITHADATKVIDDIANGGSRTEVSFLWDDQIPGGVQDTPVCGKVVGTIMGFDGHWWPEVVSDCFINCDVEGCFNGTTTKSIFL